MTQFHLTKSQYEREKVEWLVKHDVHVFVRLFFLPFMQIIKLKLKLSSPSRYVYIHYVHVLFCLGRMGWSMRSSKKVSKEDLQPPWQTHPTVFKGCMYAFQHVKKSLNIFNELLLIGRLLCLLTAAQCRNPTCKAFKGISWFGKALHVEFLPVTKLSQAPHQK